MKKLILFLFLASPLTAEEKPNILWITSEDNSSHWIGCYGNEQAQTPNIDALAKDGILFENAYSNAPVCAVARATLLMGAYSPTMGTQHMRSRHPIPKRFRPYPEYLRKTAGYYCTNNSKTDYNFGGNDRSHWNESSNEAHYKNRPEGKPFFAVFNTTVSHESSLFKNKSAEPKRLEPGEIDLPTYLPDLPEIRKDYARYHDRITAMDAYVGRILEELDKNGLSEDTIVIYNSDHGGVLPRGKRYLEETGVKVPLIIHIPEKYKDLSPFKVGQRVTEPVSFVDFPPTFLSLLDIEIPAQMQGRPFLGSKRVEPAADEMEFLFADRFDELYGMRRGLTDGKWKYIRNFNPDKATAPYSFYQFGQPGWVAYKKAYEEGKLTGIHKALWQAPGTPEQLYDLTTDPWETKNLAADPAHAERLAALRKRLKFTMIETVDTGLIPEPLFSALSGDATIADYAQGERFDVKKITDLAFTASEANPANLPRLTEAIASQDPVERYWGTVGIRILGEKAAGQTEALGQLLEDEHAAVRTTAAEALFKIGETGKATQSLMADLSSDMDSSSMLNLLNTIRRLDLMEDLPEKWVENITTQGGKHDYVKRFIERAGETK